MNNEILIDGQAEVVLERIKVVGAANVVEGTFTTPNYSGELTVQIPYFGIQYIIGLIISPVGGSTETSAKAGKGGVVGCALWKYDEDFAPTYNSTSPKDDATYIDIYKTTGIDLVSSHQYVKSPFYNSSLVADMMVTIKENNKFIVKVRGTSTSWSTASYGFYTNTEYKYTAIYSAEE